MGQQSSILPASPSKASTRGFEPISDFQPIERGSPQWKANRRTCADCNVAYGLFTRPHHCRVCGECFCDKCCPTRHLFHDNRACKDCTIKGITETKDKLLIEARKRSDLSPRR